MAFEMLEKENARLNQATSLADIQQSPLYQSFNIRLRRKIDRQPDIKLSLRAIRRVFDITPEYKSTADRMYDAVFKRQENPTTLSKFNKHLAKYGPQTAMCGPDDWTSTGMIANIPICAFLFLQTHAKSLNLQDFVYAPLYLTVGRPEILGSTIANLLYQSRVHYIFTKRYVPVVLNVLFTADNCEHSTTLLYLPKMEQGTVTFYRVFIDTSAITRLKDECQSETRILKESIRMGQEIYMDFCNEYQRAAHCEFHNVQCIGDIQKQYGTCAIWSFSLAVLFLSNWKFIVKQKPRFIESWCTQLTQITYSEKMHTFMYIMFDLRNLMASYLFDMTTGTSTWKEFIHAFCNDTSKNSEQLVKITKKLLKRIQHDMTEIHPIQRRSVIDLTDE